MRIGQFDNSRDFSDTKVQIINRHNNQVLPQNPVD